MQTVAGTNFCRARVARQYVGRKAPARLRAGALVTAFQHGQPQAAAPAPSQLAGVAPLSCEVLRGSMVGFSGASGQHVPTAVLVHGILGSRRNLQGFARMIVEGFPSWQVVLVDLRCHGESAAAAGAAPAPGPHSVDSAARDVLELLRGNRMFPQMLIGHSFGGKVVLSMARQFAAPGTQLPRPVHVWVLDAPPGEARAGGGGGPGSAGGADHPARLIEALAAVPLPIAGRNELIDTLTRQGFSVEVARWMTTNLRPAAGGGLTWSFDLGGITQLYQSYESTQLWDLLRAPPRGLEVNFVKAARSAFGWDGEAAIGALGHGVHVLDSGHWVHAENPGGLFDIMAPSLHAVDLHTAQSTAQSSRLQPKVSSR